MLPLLLILTAPVLQIILSVLRIKGRINTSIGLIAVGSFVLGIGLSAASMFVAIYSLPPGVKCITGEVAILPCGIFINLISALITGIICYVIYYYKSKQLAT